MSPNGIGLANAAVLMSVINGLIAKGTIDKADDRLWLNNAITMIEETKMPPGQRKSDALAIVQKRIAGSYRLRLAESLGSPRANYGMTDRRFPPPWTVEKIPGGLVMRDANGQSLAYVYSRENDSDARMAKVLTEDEARRIASNIAKLPTLLGKAG